MRETRSNHLVQRTRDSRFSLQIGRQWSRAADHKGVS
jgi:hypothetical protein